MERIGIRELRNETSKVVRRAKSGERIIVTIDGVPAAQLVPIDAGPRERSIAELIAMGAILPPRSTSTPRPASPVKLRPGARTSTEVLLEDRGRLMLFLDTSALLKRYVDEDGTGTVVAAMAGDQVWIASSIAGAETEAAIARLPVAEDERARQLRRFEEDWEHFRVVPADAECLRVAARIATEQEVRIIDAIHLAAASRLPRPFRFLTFDPAQAEAARALDFDVRGAGS